MKLTIAFIAAAALMLGACDKKNETPAPKTVESPTITTTPAPAATAAVTVNSVTVGKSVNAQMLVETATDTFAKNDTFYASVSTTGAGSLGLKAKWTYSANGQDVLVNESSQTINPTGPSNTEFHISKPDGWPAGDYKVEISSPGNASTTRTFSVK